MLRVNQLNGFGVGRVGSPPGPPTDPHFANVKLLCGFDGVDGATSYTEESAAARTATFVANAQLDTAFQKFGTASLLLDGTGDGLTFPASADFRLGSAPFTIECWGRFGAVPGGSAVRCLVSLWDQTNQMSWSVNYSRGAGGTSHVLRMSASTNGTSATAPLSVPWNPNTGPSTPVQYHLVIDRDTSGVMRAYQDGVFLGKATFTSTFHPSTSNLCIGGLLTSGAITSGFEWNGGIDEVRLTPGISRYGDVYGDTGFTAPSSAFPRS